MRLIDIADERFWQILFDEACIEGQQAERIEKELEKLIDEQPKVGEWIPCSERLPELDEGYGYFKQSRCCLCAGRWYDGEITEDIGWYNQSGKWNIDSKNYKVIAWQPLPEPYKENADD